MDTRRPQRLYRFILVIAAATALGKFTEAQMVLHGRMRTARFEGSAALVALSPIRVFATLEGGDAETIGFRTWETEPAGWYRLSGPGGRYTVLFSSPAHYARPVILTNIYTRDGDDVVRTVTSPFAVASFFDGAWDRKPARRYYQCFEATGTSITHVGFKLATDGVDGAGPGSQPILVSVHEKRSGSPSGWPQVGPTARAPFVDCGGPKSYWYSVGWNSGEVATQSGTTYAVCLRPEDPQHGVQSFWRELPTGHGQCFRQGGDAAGFVDRELWMAVASDGDGLLIPYNKCVHTKYAELTRFARRWVQTYVAQGRSVASVILYAAVSGVQPPLSRQRLCVRIRQGGPHGPIVGTSTIAVGNGNYTGDASWGTFGVTFAPGEVPVKPGAVYAVDFESIEDYRTLHGFVNIKGQVSDDRPGFNPYKKVAPDTYERGTAYYAGTEAVGFDLDMQIIEYEKEARGWARAVASQNLVSNGDMNRAEATAWRPFKRQEGTTFAFLRPEPPEPSDCLLRIAARNPKTDTVDGGVCQCVRDLKRADTYRFAGQVRCTWPLDVDRQCMVGYDPTGQVKDPEAGTIVWQRLPRLHGRFIPFSADPIRPEKDMISIWLRARATTVPPFPFEADFDAISLRRVLTCPP